MAIREPVNLERLLDRVVHYAKAAGASESATQQMVDMLQSPEGTAVLNIPADEIDSLLVNDVYKIRMQNMYSQFMTGVAADFALKIRRCKADVSSKHVLADMRQDQPEIYSALMKRVCKELQHMNALDPRVLEALEEYHNGFKPPKCMGDRLLGAGAATITWQDIDGSPIAIGSGPIEAASNTETSCMQAVQAAIVAAAAASRSAENTAAGSSNSGSSGSPVFVFDRTERLANSLGRMVAVCEEINNVPHKFQIMLMAGRRSTDLLHLLLQNLYFMKYVRGYIGTSSVLVLALFKPLLEKLGYSREQRQQLVKGLLGTHAHEMTSMTQQLLVKYDEEAGRRCGLNVPVCITQLLAHLLFLAANGDQKATTALSDTFTTPYFVSLAMLTKPPREFIEDMDSRWGVKVHPNSRVFDVFSTWRLDSGDYPTLAQLLQDSWQQRNKDRAAAGLQPLAPLQIIQSNIETVDDIRTLADLPDQIRPHVLGFGGLADGFQPFDPVRSGNIGQTAVPDQARSGNLGQSAGSCSQCCSDSCACSSPAEAPAGPDSSSSKQHQQQQDGEEQQEHLELPVCSLVMKAVQARLAGDSSSSSSSSKGQASSIQPSSKLAAADGGSAAEGVYDFADPNAVSGADAACGLSTSSSTSKHALLSGSLQESAVKIGDDGSLGKAQVDPRLPHETQTEVLTRVQAMIDAGKGLKGLDQSRVRCLSEVLREAYVAVAREGVLMAAGGSAAQ